MAEEEEMKKMILLIATLAGTQAFAVDDLCRSQVVGSVTNSRSNPTEVSLLELDSSPITENGVRYEMTRFQVEGKDDKGLFSQLVIVFERPNLKCYIRNIL